MGLGVDIRVDAKRHRRNLSHFAGHAIQTMQLAKRFDVEAKNAGLDCRAHLVCRFPHAGKDCLARIAAGGKYARELTAGNNIETGAELGKQVENGQAGVGFDRIADQVRRFGKSPDVGLISLFERLSGINIEWGAEAFGKLVQ